MVSRNKLTMCRLCLSENVCFINIFEFNDCQGYVAADAIYDMLKFQVSVTDGYPHVVCSKCLNKLTDFRQFKKCCQESKVTYDNMIVQRENLEDHRPEMVDYATVKSEAIYCSDNEGNDSEPIIKQEELDISGDEYEEPFEGTNTELIESDASVSVGSLELPAAIMEGFTKEADGDDSGSELCVVGVLREESSDEELIDVEMVTNPKYLQCLEDKRPHSSSEIEGDACTWSISTNDESIFEKSKNILLSEDVEASYSGTMERLEGQRILPGESMYLDAFFQQDNGIGKEVEMEKGRTEGDRAGNVEGWRGTGPENEVRERLECVHCGIVLTNKLDLKRHMKVHEFVNSYECSVCGEAFCSNSEFKRHVLTHTVSKPYKCGECSKSFSGNYLLKRHMRSHTGSKPYKCTECSKSYSENRALKRHMISHTGSKPYKCAECGKCFGEHYLLKNHLRSHTGSRPYKCPDCSKSYGDLSNFKKHINMHSGSKPHKCPECRKCFSENFLLQRHIRRHSDSKPYNCADCSKSFRDSSNLKKHMIVHTGSKPYKCSICSKSFSQSGALKRHLITHTAYTPYQCAECCKCFSGSDSLKRHMISHTVSKPFKCAECAKCFSQKYHLKTHLRSHTGSKPYKCEDCCKCFSDISNFKRHIRKHTGSKPYKCAECGKCFSQNGDLKRHASSHTNLQPCEQA